MPVDDIIAICIVVPMLISLIVLLYIISIKTVNEEKKLKDSTNRLNEIKINYYKWLLKEENFYNDYDEEREE